MHDLDDLKEMADMERKRYIEVGWCYECELEAGGINHVEWLEEFFPASEAACLRHKKEESMTMKDVETTASKAAKIIEIFRTIDKDRDRRWIMSNLRDEHMEMQNGDENKSSGGAA